MYLGPEMLKQTIEKAELYPIRGLFKFRDYFPEIDAYYHRVLGDELGVSTGWRCLDEYYNVSIIYEEKRSSILNVTCSKYMDDFIVRYFV